MKEITVKDKVYKLKKDYLTNGEVNYIVSSVIDIYRKEEDIVGYKFSPLSAMSNFYFLLFQLCIDGYDADDNDMYEELYCAGVHKTLIEEVTNADEAYDLLLDTMDNLQNIGNILSTILGEIVSKLPDAKDLNDIAEKLPEQWKEAIGRYEDITGISAKEDTTEENE